MTRRTTILALLTAVAGLLFPALLAAPAQAAGRVSVANASGSAQIDGTYSTKLTVSGNGFQSIKNGHGGVYVWFGTVNGAWKPSQGGVSGQNYQYIPDAESENNKGFQRYVAFPGSDTASSAHAVMTDSGAWRTTITVPGPTFKVVGRNGSVATVDCRKVQCGVITIGAHGQKNANNETFTPVSVGTVSSALPEGESADESTGDTTDAPAAVAPGDVQPVKQKRRGKPKLTVDRASASAGRGLSFVAEGMTPGSQVTIVLDDGIVASGPHFVGDDGVVAGVLQLPADLAAGTHELRTFGVAKSASVKFGLAGASSSAPDADHSDNRDEQGASVAALVFAVGALIVFLAALFVTVRRMVRGRRAEA